MATTKKTTKTTVAATSNPPTDSPTISRARSTRTKADVSDAFTEISKASDTREPLDQKFVDQQRMNEDRVRKTASSLAIDKVVQDASAISLTVGRALSGLSEQLVQKLGEFEDVSQAVDYERQELARLHQIDVAKCAIDNLVEEYRNKQSDLISGIEYQKAAWTKEAFDYAKTVSERNTETEKSRKRELADYEYNKVQEAKFAKEALNEELRKIARNNQDRQEDLERDWATRESTIKMSEAELANMRAQVAAFPEQLKKEVAKGEAIVTNTLNSKFQTEKTLLQKEMETNTRIFSQEKAALQATILQQTNQISALQDQLEKVKEASQSVVLKALDSASGRATLEQITTFAQNKDGSTSKSKS